MTDIDAAKRVSEYLKGRYADDANVEAVGLSEDTHGWYVVVVTKKYVVGVPLRQSSVRIRQIGRGDTDIRVNDLL